MDGSISFFVPCLNEEGNVGRVIDEVVELMKDIRRPYEFIVFDDASTDGTVAEVLDRKKKYPEIRIELVQNKFCRGLGRNYLIASYLARGEYYRIAFGDAEESPASIKATLEHIGEADAVLPYLYPDDPRIWPRKFLSRVFVILVNVLSGHRLKYYNGSVVHRTENVRWYGANTMGFGYQAELLCRLLDAGKTVLQLPVSNRGRTLGDVKVFRMRNVVAVISSLGRIFLRRLARIGCSRCKCGE